MSEPASRATRSSETLPCLKVENSANKTGPWRSQGPSAASTFAAVAANSCTDDTGLRACLGDRRGWQNQCLGMLLEGIAHCLTRAPSRKFAPAQPAHL